MTHRTSDLNPVIEAQSVQIFVRRVNITFAIGLLLSALVLFFLIYKPLSNALEQSLIANFEQMSHVSYQTLQGSIQRSIEGAKSLSSRTMIRNAVEDYVKGLSSFEELMTYTQPKYEDGAKALEHLILAERYVGSRMVACYMPSEYPGVFDISSNFSDKKGLNASKLFIFKDRIYYAYRSPVVAQGGEIAYDGLVFDITANIQALSTDNIDTRLLDEDDYQALIRGSELIHGNDKTTVVKTPNTILAAVRCQDATRFVSQQSRSVLLAPINKLRTQVFIVGIGTLIAFIAVINLYVIRFAKTELSNLEIRHVALEKVAEKVNIDALTSAGSRSSGTDALMRAFQDYKTYGSPYAVMMFDIDSFKSINDSYGHIVGDEVLKRIVDAVYRTIRKDDQLFRWGGDEFVGIFGGISEDHVSALAEKTRGAISALSIDAGAGTIYPTVSMGISFFLDSDEEFSEALMRADKAMYMSKLEGKNSIHVL